MARLVQTLVPRLVSPVAIGMPEFALLRAYLRITVHKFTPESFNCYKIKKIIDRTLDTVVYTCYNRSVFL